MAADHTPAQSKSPKSLDPFLIDLSDLEIEEVEIFAQEGSRGLPDFAASTAATSTCCNTCDNSCTIV